MPPPTDFAGIKSGILKLQINFCGLIPIPLLARPPRQPPLRFAVECGNVEPELAAYTRVHLWARTRARGVREGGEGGAAQRDVLKRP